MWDTIKPLVFSIASSILIMGVGIGVFFEMDLHREELNKWKLMKGLEFHCGIEHSSECRAAAKIRLENGEVKKALKLLTFACKEAKDRQSCEILDSIEKTIK